MLAVEEVELMKQDADWSRKTVLVIGIARQGIALTRYLVKHGAGVIVNDRRDLDQLRDAQEALADINVRWETGGHPLTILDDVDLVCVSGGVPVDLPIVVEAARRGIALSNDSQLFLEACPCKVVGITGSAGKTTTTTLVGLIAQAAVEQFNLGSSQPESHKNSLLGAQSQVWVGGNIGSPLISVLENIKPNDLAVMELSSFQLEIMETSPDIAVVINITPNHLDRHKTMENYIDAKSRILKNQSSRDTAVLNRDDPVFTNLQKDVQGRLVTFGMNKPDDHNPSVFYDPIAQKVRINSVNLDGEMQLDVIRQADIPLRGDHNLSNVLAACATAMACGISPSAMEAGIKNFSGIPHRLEFVRSYRGGDWYNDSIATAPERSIAAINSFAEPLILLAGGRDKDLPWDSFASLVCQRVRDLILFGEAASIVSDALSPYEKKSCTSVTICAGLEDAVKAAATKVTNGDVVLLSPGGTSFDEFTDFEERGEAYKKWVMELV